MTAYEFYVLDEDKRRKLLGILPERRLNQERINEETIMNWARLYFGGLCRLSDIRFDRIDVQQNARGNYFWKEG